MNDLIKIIKKLKLCMDKEYFELLKKSIVFNDNIDLSGIYSNNSSTILVTPNIVDNLTLSIAIHEAGHLYDYYKNGEIIESEDTALAWEFKFLYSKKEYELINNRIREILNNKDSLKYKSIIKRN